ncbi:hypothetical protein K9N68_14740 [Kovacikia minuta CCNUW1]|uniref:hypothetical protein n=1 Tax=Kovacikia minuta TaxID=2931930 RepID=UPI001CCD71C7|nr:hypothetical protein [Kovacikia minuta]UBF28980.1 hypothetical protein K9N68_14740 [Kovacikia minuta CCNUW1]
MMKTKFFLLFILLSVLTSCVATTSPSASNQAASTCPPPAQQNQIGTRTIAPTNLKVGKGYSTAVISNAQKFLIPVPAFGQSGEPLVYPPSHEKAGQPILDYQGKPVGDRGLVFFNGKDKSWQAAPGDGEAVIIINEVSPQQAKQIDQKIRSYTPDPNRLTLKQLKEVLAFVQEDLKLDDMYNSNRPFIRENMTPAIVGEVVTVNGKEIEAYGFKKRDARDINQAIYIPGEFVFQGPAATPQKFANGGVIVEQGGKMRGVQPDIFERTYRFSNGKAISSARTDIAIQCGFSLNAVPD